MNFQKISREGLTEPLLGRGSPSPLPSWISGSTLYSGFDLISRALCALGSGLALNSSPTCIICIYPNIVSGIVLIKSWQPYEYCKLETDVPARSELQQSSCDPTITGTIIIINIGEPATEMNVINWAKVLRGMNLGMQKERFQIWIDWDEDHCSGASYGPSLGARFYEGE